MWSMDFPKCYKCFQVIQPENFILQGLHSSCFCEWFEVNDTANFEDIIARTSDVSSKDWARITSSFFHGKFRKYSAQLGEKNYILKVQQQELPELPAMEYLCNQIARALGLWVPDHFFIKFENELDTFVCNNFMQKHPGCDLVHIYRFLEKPEQYCCEGLLHILEKKVQKFEDIQRLVEICLFDSLIGNHDRHGRNLGLIQSGSELRLAPFYDNPSYIALELPLLLGALHEPGGAIATKETREPTMKDYVKEWLRLDLGDPIKKFKNQIDLSEIHALIRNSFVSPRRQQAFINLIKRRYEELCHASKTL